MLLQLAQAYYDPRSSSRTTTLVIVSLIAAAIIGGLYVLRQRGMLTPKVSGAAMGFIVGVILVWQGCGRGTSLAGAPEGLAMCAFGGAIFAILGALLGSSGKGRS